MTTTATTNASSEPRAERWVVRHLDGEVRWYLGWSPSGRAREWWRGQFRAEVFRSRNDAMEALIARGAPAARVVRLKPRAKPVECEGYVVRDAQIVGCGHADIVRLPQRHQFGHGDTVRVVRVKAAT